LTPHHILADHCVKGVKKKKGKEKYKHGNAPCICATGRSWNSVGPNNQPLKHNRYHRRFDGAEAKAVLTPDRTKAQLAKLPASPDKIKESATWKYKDAKSAAADCCEKIDGCARDCIEAQLKSYYEKRCGIGENDDLKCQIDRGAMYEGAREQIKKGL